MGAASSQLQFCACFDFSSAQGEYKENLAVTGCNCLIQECHQVLLKRLVPFGRPQIPHTIKNQELRTGRCWLDGSPTLLAALSWVSLHIPSPSLSPANSQHPPRKLGNSGETRAAGSPCCNSEHKQLPSTRGWSQGTFFSCWYHMSAYLGCVAPVLCEAGWENRFQLCGCCRGLICSGQHAMRWLSKGKSRTCAVTKIII